MRPGPAWDASGNVPRTTLDETNLVVGLRLMRPLVRRAVVKGRTMLVDARLVHIRSLRSCYGKRWAQAGNQCKCDCDPQFHTSSIAGDMTRERDARIHLFVVSGSALPFHTSSLFLHFAAILRIGSLRGIGEECIFLNKMTFKFSRFGFTFRYWRSFWSQVIGPARGIGGVAVI